MNCRLNIDQPYNIKSQCLPSIVYTSRSPATVTPVPPIYMYISNSINIDHALRSPTYRVIIDRACIELVFGVSEIHCHAYELTANMLYVQDADAAIKTVT